MNTNVSQTLWSNPERSRSVAQRANRAPRDRRSIAFSLAVGQSRFFLIPKDYQLPQQPPIL
ncbi:MAG: hypothetical protein F6K55_42680 [Moorea sp. SIO4A3]|nr:hypothetical protein [Moorena sp. SIO4A3]